MTSPLVSVLMTAFNRERYIAASIESVLAQTFTDFELVIVDDASTDGTVAVAERYLSDPRVRLMRNGRNLGDYANRNHASSFARGELMKYHDSDDVMYAHCLGVMVPMLLSEPSAAFSLSSGGSWPGGPCPMLLTPRMAYQREFFGGGLFMCGASGALFRAEAFRRLGGFADEGAPSDYLFWLRACTRVNVLLVPGDLFWYRTHPSQELRSRRAAGQYARALGAAWRALNAPECPLSPGEREQAKRNCMYTLAKKSYYDLRAGRWGTAWERLSCSGVSSRDLFVYLRRPQRATDAGTPKSAEGEYVMPSVDLRREFTRQ